jgi:hypothetical protein
MQALNGSTQIMGYAEFLDLELEIGGMKSWAHAYIVPFAAFIRPTMATGCLVA